ncbi:acyl dehydratase [Afipia sp. P52-10]|uniref:MaoC family dehydratase n=1 Tax=Afipia sp. P52-10 TaxID=1429916 RepID=UPI0003DF456E|nr:MaoC family dehydratase [Afipia sp. P52-10]ETR78693.1 acyl dehydratase [Afipia sp. P52-10]
MDEMLWRDRCFEDFAVGDVCKHRQSRTITEYDNMLFTLMTQNPAPLHIDKHFAKAMGHTRPIVNSTLTLALVTGQSVADLTPNVITNLGWDKVRLPAPVFEGDTIYSQSMVEALRPSASRKDAGIITLQTVGYTQEGVIVLQCARTVVIARRGFEPKVQRPEPADIITPREKGPS